MQAIFNKLPGIGLTLLIAIPAWFIGKSFPIIGGPVLGILFGMILAFWKRSAVFDEGVKYTSKKLLQYSIILLGFDMNLYNVMQVGGETLTLMLFTLTVAFGTAFIAGKLLKIDPKTNILIGVGTAICGGSAIAATAPVIRADDTAVARSISTIFLFNVIAAFLFPVLGHLLGMGNHAFGLWAGTAINDTSCAPRSARSKAGGTPAWEGLASHPVSSLGTEAVTPGLSVGKKGSRPKAQAEDVESRNSQWEWSMHGTSRRQY